MLLPVLASLAAAVPTLQTTAPCYLERQPVQLAGAGFIPGAPYNVTLDRTPVGSGKVGADGKLRGTLSSGKLSHSQRQKRHLIAVHDSAGPGGHAGFEVSAFEAAFTPSVGDPRTLSVRFTVAGIGVAAPASVRVWLHYVDPHGQMRKTLSLGVTHGPCGSLTSSAKRRLFPFSAVSAGRWKLQFDLRHAYSSSTQPRITRLVAVK